MPVSAGSSPSAVPPTPLLATLDPVPWAEAPFGGTALGDARRTRRLVRTAAAVATRPDASLPQQLGDPAALKGAYRLFASDAVTFGAVLDPHLAQAAAEPVVLLVQDTTELEFSTHPATTGLAPLRTERSQGFLLQTVLAVTPDPRLPLGVLAAEPVLRQRAPTRGESSAQRQRRARESGVWPRLVTAVGAPPDGTQWVHVADRGADCFPFFVAARQTGTDVLVRVVQNRCVTDAEDAGGYLIDVLRDQPAADRRPLAVPARPAQRDRPAQPARDTEVAISWTALTLTPPTNWPRGQATPAPLPVWAVRVWEPDPPPAPSSGCWSPPCRSRRWRTPGSGGIGTRRGG